MPLLNFWRLERDAVREMSIEQVVATAGSGALLDDSDCSTELRGYLKLVPLDYLERYAQQCLIRSFDKSGRVLQDIINEVGRRLDFDVRNGLYQGLPGHIGFDGVWISPEGEAIVVEVKTTDAYRIKLDTIAQYRRALISQSTLSDRSSILIVVGRQDTGELEAQIRGSRHGWDTRLISVDALLKMVKLKQDTDDPNSAVQIRTLLRPFDYTRLDQIVDIMFTAAQDVEAAASEGSPPELPSNSPTEPPQPAEDNQSAILETRSRTIRAMEEKLGLSLIQKTRVTFWDSSHSKRIVCTVSKAYPNPVYRFWYAFHPAQNSFLKEGQESYIVWAGVGLDTAFCMPQQFLEPLLSKMTKTIRDDRMYWHIKILYREDKYWLQVPGDVCDCDLTPFHVPLTSAA